MNLIEQIQEGNALTMDVLRMIERRLNASEFGRIARETFKEEIHDQINKMLDNHIK